MTERRNFWTRKLIFIFGMAACILCILLTSENKRTQQLVAQLEFRDRQRKTNRTVAGQDSLAPVIDDLEAEGQTRLIDLIASAASEREAPPAGVWASFGKPYACLGALEQLDGNLSSLLPHLNRDDLYSSQQQCRPGQRSSTQGVQNDAIRTAAALAAGGTGAVNVEANGAAGSAASVGSSSRDQQEAELLRHKTVMKFSTMERLEASFPAAAVQQADARRKAAKTHPNKFFNKSLADSDLTNAAASYGHQGLQLKQLPGHELLAHHQAASVAVEAAAAAAQAGAAAAASLRQAAGGVDTGGSKVSVFMTQRATAACGSSAAADSASLNRQQQLWARCTGSEANGVDGSSCSRGRSKSPGHRIAILANRDDRNSMAAAAATASRRSSVAAAGRSSVVGVRHATRASVSCMAGTAPHQSVMDMSGNCLDLGSAAAAAELADSACSTAMGVAVTAAGAGVDMQPGFKALTELTLQQHGVADPVIKWHNEFVQARQAGRTALQSTLWERSQARAVARSQPAGRAQLSSSLMHHLHALGGKLAPGCTPGIFPDNPYAASIKAHTTTAAAGSEGPPTPGTRPIKQSEVELLEHFYDALCGLVERQRLSDPLSLMVVHMVKALLEGGTVLQPALLQQVIDKVAEFVKSCGLIRYNRFALPLLTFIRKCVGVSQAELESMAGAAGISGVVFEDDGKPDTTSSGAAPAPAPAVAVARGSCDGSTKAAAALIAPLQGLAKGLAPEPSCDSVAKRSSKLGSDSSTLLGAEAAAVPPIPIDAAVAAAVADIKHAVQSAPASQRAAAAGNSSVSGSPCKQVRIPGVAGHVEVLQANSSASIGSTCGTADTASVAAHIPKLDLQNHPAQAIADEPLPDLGDDASGLPWSRRARQVEGMESWPGSQRQQQQEPIIILSKDAAAEAQHQ